jgi:hypothetical protein
MKTHIDESGREYFIKEGEIHYLDEEAAPRKKKPRLQNNRIIVACGAAITLVAIGVILGNIFGSAPPTSDLSQVRTQVVLEQTQTANAPFAISPTARPRNGRENVLVPFEQYMPTYTQGLYSGRISLVISGFGQAGGNDYSDAFYLFENAEGIRYNPPRTEQFDLEIDGQRAIIALGLRETPPPFAGDHIYRVMYDVGLEFRQIAFRISDESVNDNRGEFVIEVAAQRPNQ